jgi:CubicO group peptidase (beta-lactamase class C family)
MRCNHNDLTYQEYVERLTYLSQSARWLSCRKDDGREGIYSANPPPLELGGAGLVSTAYDYLRCCRMMLKGGTLDGAQILAQRRSRGSA